MIQPGIGKRKKGRGPATKRKRNEARARVERLRADEARR